MRRFALLVVLAGICSASLASNDFGRFVGTVVAEWLQDGRQMKLLRPFEYDDPRGQRWFAPAGSIVDGASIPRWAWAVIGGPFEGKYRDASVIHDVACVTRDRPWQDVHRAFYLAMRAAGVDEVQAKVMYGAVYWQGPRWERSSSRIVAFDQRFHQMSALEQRARKDEHVTVAMSGVVTEQSEVPAKAYVSAIYRPETVQVSNDELNALKLAIEKKNLTLEQIEDYQFDSSNN
jgi:hypothetical protein